MKNYIDKIKNKFVGFQEKRELSEDGFSLLELVVAIGILLVLTVGGLIGYSAITNNAKDAAVQSAVSEIATSAAVKEANGDTNTGAMEAATDWLGSAQDGKFNVFIDEDTNSIKVETADGKHSASRGSTAASSITTPVE